MFFSKIYEILAWAVCIFPITLGRVKWSTPNNDSTIKRSQIEAFRNTLFYSEKFRRVPEKNSKNEGSQIFFNQFHDVAISSFVQYQFQITKM